MQTDESVEVEGGPFLTVAEAGAAHAEGEDVAEVVVDGEGAVLLGHGAGAAVAGVEGAGGGGDIDGAGAFVVGGTGFG